ncbi:Ig-like domain-containing protein [Melioribacter sp. OK-6-Me]|uniref:Ig-like domain-containing protein n=1 Tax=unclassified Melioribacter TaxID=2627329 RepID=UPI003ED9EA8E
MAKKSEQLIVLLIFIFLQSCANQLPPGGGPEDTMPPSVVEVNPPPGSTNFNGNSIEVTFSEYINKSSVRNAIFVSPPLKYPIKYRWSGTTLRLELRDTLRRNTTYTITIGAEVEDYNSRNKMLEPYTFAFSTGNTIDVGKVAGKVYDDNPSGVMILAFKHNAGTEDLSMKEPDYISQVGKNGRYMLLGLSNGEYDVIAIKDKLNDLKYQINDDYYGVQFKRVIIDEGNKEINDLDFMLTLGDTIPPKLSDARAIDSYRYLIEFNESVDSTKINSTNFYLVDSLTEKRFDPRFFYKGKGKKNQFYISLQDTLPKSGKTFLVAENIPDLNGNLNTRDIIPITPISKEDTSAPAFIGIEGVYPENKIDYENPVIRCTFDEGFAFPDSFIVVSDKKGNSFSYRLEKIDDAAFNIILKSRLRQASEYELKINLSKITDLQGNKADSVLSVNFTTANELEFSAVSGNVISNRDSSNIYIVLKSVDTGKNYIKKAVANKFEINKVIPGKYVMWNFVDSDGNGSYSYGSIKPYRYAEKFSYYPDTLNLRARWPVGGINLYCK